jgi:hypothetical protein
MVVEKASGRDSPLWQGAGKSSWILPISLLIFGLREALVKIGGSAFVSSNSKNISYVTFLKHKNSRK